MVPTGDVEKRWAIAPQLYLYTREGFLIRHFIELIRERCKKGSIRLFPVGVCTSVRVKVVSREEDADGNCSSLITKEVLLWEF